MDNKLWSDYLVHHGIKGQKWGVKNGPPYPLDSDVKKYAYSNLKKAKTSNIDKWGKDEDHNILYITGYSGSGKSTIANQLSKDNKSNNIHLDLYFEKTSRKDRKNQDKEFNSYLDKNFPEWKTIGTDKDRFSKTWWEKVDKLMKSTEEFGKEQFGKKKVIVEGVQLADESAYLDRSFFKDKPVIIAQTSALKSILRASIRDEIKLSERIKNGKELIASYSNFNKRLNELETITDANKYQKIIEQYLKENK